MVLMAKSLQIVDCERLEALLADELTHYRRLLRLARRQNSYMRRQDVRRLDANSREWNRHLPAANAARMARERLVQQLAAETGVAVPPGRVGDLLDYTEPGLRREIASHLQAIRKTAADLARQNEMNRSLAEFCLDLAREEAEIFKRCVLDDPSGCYGGDARTAGRGPGGVLVRQA